MFSIKLIIYHYLNDHLSGYELWFTLVNYCIVHVLNKLYYYYYQEVKTHPEVEQRSSPPRSKPVKCDYENLCSEFVSSMALPCAYFNIDSVVCYCVKCHEERGDAPTYYKVRVCENLSFIYLNSKILIKCHEERGDAPTYYKVRVCLICSKIYIPNYFLFINICWSNYSSWEPIYIWWEFVTHREILS